MKKIVTSAVAALCAIAFSQVDPARVVVTINGDPVKGGEYYRRMEYLPGVGKVTGRAVSEFPPGFLTIEQLITERLVLQLAKQKNVLPSDIEVASELKARQEATPDLVASWQASGRTLQELNYQIRYELAQFKLATFGVTITDQEVEKHYKENPTEFTTPRQYKMRIIVVANQDAQKLVDKELAAGKDFGEVAKTYSVQELAPLGGDMGNLPETAFSTRVLNAIKSVQPGQTTQWIENTSEAGTAYIRFKVEAVTPAKLSALTPGLKRNLRRRLMMDRGRVKGINVEKEMKELRAKANIVISQPEFAEAYKKFVEAYLKQGG